MRARPSRTFTQRASRRWSSIPISRKRTPRYGMALHYLDRYPEAVVEFERAIALDPNLFEAYYLYGFAARDAGDLETSVRMGERCVAI